ncbi:hypothetical protein Tco_0960920 [Tanacetum coccineum]
MLEIFFINNINGRLQFVNKQKTLMQTQEDHSHQTQAVNSDSLKIDLVVKQNSCSKKEDGNSETASSKSAKKCSLNFETKDVHAIKYNMSKAKERCMAYFRSLHSHLQQWDAIWLTTESTGQTQREQDDCTVRNDTYADDADIRPIYDKEPMADVQLTTECNIFAIGQQHTKQPEIIVEGTSINVQKEQGKSQSMAAEKADISETIVKVDSQMMIQNNDLDLLFGPLFDEYFNGENQVVLKSSAVTTTDASNKRQQPDSTSSTLTLATTVSANGNFDL